MVRSGGVAFALIMVTVEHRFAVLPGGGVGHREYLALGGVPVDVGGLGGDGYYSARLELPCAGGCEVAYVVVDGNSLSNAVVSSHEWSMKDGEALSVCGWSGPGGVVAVGQVGLIGGVPVPLAIRTVEIGLMLGLTVLALAVPVRLLRRLSSGGVGVVGE